MSTSEGRSFLSFVDELGVADLRVADSRLQTVAQGVGHLKQDLPAGLYRLEARSGANTTVRLVELEPGGSYSETADVSIASPVPLAGTTTSHEYHQQAAMQASEQLAARGGTGIALVVRDLRDRPGSHLDEHWFDRVGLAQEGLGDVLPWQIDHDLDVATRVMSLPPGDYALRMPLESAEFETDVSVEQALSVVPGHQTLVFVPNTTRGPRFELASICLVPGPWHPSANEPTGALVAETILDGLRTGNPVVPEFDEQWIGTNLMLGVLAVHALVLSPNPDLERAERLAGVTQTQLFGGNDAAVLGYVIQERRAQIERRPAPQPHPAAAATAPPMLRTAYDALIRHDIAGGRSIVGGSPAELVAEHLVNRGVWTTWRADRTPRPELEAWRAFEPPSAIREPVSFPINLADIGSSTAAVQSLGPGARRVAGYLVSVAEAAANDPDGAPVGDLSELHVAAACRLPVQAVRRAHQELTSMLVPTP